MRMYNWSRLHCAALLYLSVLPVTLYGTNELDLCSGAVISLSEDACNRVRSSIQTVPGDLSFGFEVSSMRDQPFSCAMLGAINSEISQLKVRIDKEVSPSVWARDFGDRYFALHSRAAVAAFSLLTVTVMPRVCLERPHVLVVGVKKDVRIFERLVGCDGVKMNLRIGIDDICFGHAVILTLEGLDTLGGLLDEPLVRDLRAYVHVQRLDDVARFRFMPPPVVYRNRWTDLEGLLK